MLEDNTKNGAGIVTLIVCDKHRYSYRRRGELCKIYAERYASAFRGAIIESAVWP